MAGSAGLLMLTCSVALMFVACESNDRCELGNEKFMEETLLDNDIPENDVHYFDVTNNEMEECVVYQQVDRTDFISLESLPVKQKPMLKRTLRPKLLTKIITIGFDAKDVCVDNVDSLYDITIGINNELTTYSYARYVE